MARRVTLPALLLLSLLTLVTLNVLALRTGLWGELGYALAVTTGVLWGVQRTAPAARLLRWLRTPPLSAPRALLWSAFALVGIPVAVEQGTDAWFVLGAAALLWLALRATHALAGVPAAIAPPWLAAVVTLAGVLLLVAFPDAVSRAERVPRAAPGPAADAAAERALATAFRPLLFFDRGETRFPLDIEAAMEDHRVSVCRSSITGEECEPVLRPLAIDPSFHYLVVEDAPASAPSAIYFRVVPRPRRGLVYVDYWWYYARNPSPVGGKVFCAPGLRLPELSCFEHASDWEGITVALRACRRAGPLCVGPPGGRHAPVAVRYAQHRHVVSYDWTPTLERVWDDTEAGRGRPPTRPVVFVARHSHASYPVRCSERDCSQHAVDLPESRHDGRIPWRHNRRCAECVKRLPTTATGAPALWNAFHGPWGRQRCILGGAYCDVAHAPAAPSLQGRYLDPGRAGPWLCLRSTDPEVAPRLRRCGRREVPARPPGRS